MIDIKWPQAFYPDQTTTLWVCADKIAVFNINDAYAVFTNAWNINGLQVWEIKGTTANLLTSLAPAHDFFMETKMTNTFYVPIYEWGDDPTITYGSVYGCTMYLTLSDLYAFEGEYVVGYFEVTGTTPTKREFEEKHGIISSGAV